MYYSDLLFGNLTAVDPWRGGAGVSCREAVHQKREEYFVYEWAITTPLPLCRLQTLYSWEGFWLV